MALDSYDQGLVPVALFRSVLEDELKLKPKIVDDFVESCTQVSGKKSLDVNVQSNSFANHVDYMVLVRKLAQQLEYKTQEAGAEKDADRCEVRLSQTKLPETTQKLHCEKVTFKIDIESAMRIKNPLNSLEPPNAFVRLRVPLEGASVEEVKTQVQN